MKTRCLLLVILLGAGAAEAAINRCEALDGVAVYTDRTCESLGIAERTDGPIPRRRVGGAKGFSTASIANKLSSGCAARSPEGLRTAVIDAIERRDFNALSGLYNFDGRSRQTAAAVVRRLERMAKRSVTEVALVAVEAESLFDVLVVDTNALPTLRVVQSSQRSEGPLSIESFTLTRSAGCLWLGG